MRKKVDITLLHRYLAGECTEKEEKLVEKWIDSSADNRNYFQAIKKIRDIRPNRKLSVDTESAWQRLEKNLSDQSGGNTRRHSFVPGQKTPSHLSLVKESDGGLTPPEKKLESSLPKSRPDKRWSMFFRVAAIVLITFGIGYALVLFDQDYIAGGVEEAEEEMQNRNLEFAADRGESVKLSFHDGTEVTLHGGSRLEMDPDYGKDHREVHLDGKAYFDVESFNDLEFEVITSEADIRVLGTRFNVTSWEERGESEVVVRSGRVSVKSRFDANEPGNTIDQETEHIVLNENERALVKRNQVPTVTELVRGKEVAVSEELDGVSTDTHLSWLTGGMYFEDQSLGHVFQYLERRFDVDFDVKQEEILDYKVTARYGDESLEEILEITSVTHELAFSKDEQRIVVTSQSE